MRCIFFVFTSALLVLSGTVLHAEEFKYPGITDAEQTEIEAQIAKLADPAEATQQTAIEALSKQSIKALPQLWASSQKAKVSDFSKRLGSLIDEAVFRWGSIAHENGRRINPREEKAIIALLTLYKCAPEELKSRFWQAVREASNGDGEKMPQYKDRNILARLGQEPLAEESTLDLKADGSGEFHLRLDFMPMATELTIMQSEKKLTPEEVQKQINEVLAEKKPHTEPPKIEGVEKLPTPKDAKPGEYFYGFKFTSLEALNRALKAHLALPVRFLVLKGPADQLLVQREMVLELDAVFAQVGCLDGLIERFTLKSEVPIARCTGQLKNAHEAVYEGFAWDLLYPVNPAAELEKPTEEMKIPAKHAAPDVSALRPFLLKNLKQLIGPNQTQRRTILQDIQERSGAHTTESKDCAASLQALLYVYESERDFLMQLECERALQALTHRRFYLPQWAPDTWDQGVPNAQERGNNSK